ncbi:MAG: DNA polymerase IV [Verrucomicrobia bacterium]|nr:MAG: DNA polymerase IV [Verrucomicrobiota bacterium]
MTRKIIHLDMDCFFAAIEVRDNPELRGHPVAVGGASDRRGVLTTCNYEARAFGIRSAMPTFKALKQCPHLIVVPVHFDAYRRESRRVRSLMEHFSSIIEPLSLDEAYLDVTHHDRPASSIASDLRAMIYSTTGLTASAGIASNKLLAKVASDWEKPDGQFEIRPEAVNGFMQQLPVRKVWGIGPVAAGKLQDQGIATCGQLQGMATLKLQQLFGRFGTELYDLCRGQDDRPVETHRPRKSLSTECTFSTNLQTFEACRKRLEPLVEEVLEDLLHRPPGAGVSKIFLKLKFANFSKTTVERTGLKPSRKNYTHLLAEGFGRSGQPVRLIGVGVRFAESPPEKEIQLTLNFDAGHPL